MCVCSKQSLRMMHVRVREEGSSVVVLEHSTYCSVAWYPLIACWWLLRERMAQLFNKKAEAAAITPRLTFLQLWFFCQKRSSKNWYISWNCWIFWFWFTLWYLQLLEQAPFIFKIHLSKPIICRNDDDIERWLLMLNQQRQTIFVLCQFP